MLNQIRGKGSLGLIYLKKFLKDNTLFLKTISLKNNNYGKMDLINHISGRNVSN
jgi:hypothetical protein